MEGPLALKSQSSTLWIRLESSFWISFMLLQDLFLMNKYQAFYPSSAVREKILPKKKCLIDVNYIKNARKPSNDLFNFLESIQVHLTQTSLPFKKGVLKVFAQYRKGSNKTNTVLKKSVPDPIIEFHRRWKYFGYFCFEITLSTNFEESDEDLHRFKAYRDSLIKLPLASHDGRQPQLRAPGERNENFYELLGTIAVGGAFG
ncbi:hypothetical protein ACB092_03G209000 [Castanea dentata]